MLTRIDAFRPGMLSRREMLVRLLGKVQSLVSCARPAPSIHDLNARALADLNLRKWEIEYPDPRAPKLF